MKIDSFDFDLPAELIARYPLQRRDSSRLLVLNRRGTLEHRQFSDIKEYLKKGDILVLNNSKVIPARLKGQKPTGGKFEILLIRPIQKNRYEILSRGRYTGQVVFEGGLRADIFEGKEAVFYTDNLKEYLWKYGYMPLPPYIKREPLPEDKTWYQTVYARKEGSIAAPTAGLHFTDQLLEQLESKGVRIRYITLHVGIGTFMPIKTEKVEDHRMAAETFEVEKELIEEIKDAREAGHKLFAVGTTVTRTLESIFSDQLTGSSVNGKMHGTTDLFIYPGYRFKVVDALITNFHLPRSTPLLLVSAFAGWEKIMAAYKEAIHMRYRFFSYGDAMLIL